MTTSTDLPTPVAEGDVTSGAAAAAETASAAGRLLPRPIALHHLTGEFIFDAATRLSAPEPLSDVVAWLHGALRPATGLPLRKSINGDTDTDTDTATKTSTGDTTGRINTLSLALATDLAAESYRLTVASDGIRLEGGDPAGVFYACQPVERKLQQLGTTPLSSGAHQPDETRLRASKRSQTPTKCA